MRKQSAVLGFSIVAVAMITAAFAIPRKGPAFIMVRGGGLTAPVILGNNYGRATAGGTDSLSVIYHSSEPITTEVDTVGKLAEFAVAEFFGPDWAKADGTFRDGVRFEQANQFSHFIVLKNKELVWERNWSQQRYFGFSPDAKAYLQRHGIGGTVVSSR